MVIASEGDLSSADARRLAIACQGLSGWHPSATDPADRVLAMLRGLGAVQLDTISVLARSHELVAYARLGAVDRSAIEDAYWGRNAAVEYWSHAACLLPIEMWPLFAFRRRHHVRRGCRWTDAPSPRAIADVRARLEAEGPLTVSDAGGARRAEGWWQWSDAKNALEWLLLIGDVVCTRRVGWRRVYDLAERVLPQGEAPEWALLGMDQSHWVDADGIRGPSDADCLTALVTIAARTLGVATIADLADVHRITRAQVVAHLQAAGLVPVRVQGWHASAWSTEHALAHLGEASRASSRTVLLSPFDSLVWCRERTERIFGLSHRLEAYTPAARRVHGYFAMPVLHEGELVARVDPKRAGDVLVAATVTLQTSVDGAVPTSAIRGTARAIVEAASWVHAPRIRIDNVVPATARPALIAALGTESPAMMNT